MFLWSFHVTAGFITVYSVKMPAEPVGNIVAEHDSSYLELFSRATIALRLDWTSLAESQLGRH